ncbi:MAG: hypothetical protein M4579_007465 [Chaenotheca gracillima]|nr:MAG: hypothetical protein M4579_007465 [Chaenotheca gracillima]
MLARHCWLRFRKIPFEQLVRHALGFAADAVDEFLDYHGNILPAVLRTYLHLRTNQREPYIRVARILRNECPPADAAVARILKKSRNRSHMLSFIVTPLQAVLRGPDRTIDQILI